MQALRRPKIVKRDGHKIGMMLSYGGYTQFRRSLKRFGPFELRQIAEGAYELSKEGARIELDPQPVKLLWLLTSAPERVFNKEELARELQVADERVRRIVEEVRRALGDDAEAPRYIKTIQRAGYKFIAKVKPPANYVVRVGAVVVLIAVVTGIAFLVRHRLPKLEEVVMNETAKNLTTIALSPDGQKLAFADNRELYVRSTVETAQTTRIKAPELGSLAEVSSLAWSLEGNTLFLAGRDRVTGRSGLWRLALGVGPPTKLADNVAEVAASPDGQMAWIAADRTTIFTCRKESGDCHQTSFVLSPGRVLSGISWLSGNSIVVGSFSTNDYQLHLTLQSMDLNGLHQRELIHDEPVTAFCALSDGRLLYATAEAKSQGQYDAKLWELRAGSAERRLLGQWTDSILSAIGGALGSEKTAILRGHYSADVYVADVVVHNIENVRSLTTYDSNEFPTTWTVDSQRVIYHSDHLGSFGNFGLFSQGLEETDGRSLIRSPFQDIRGARVSPDGEWIVYYTRRLPNPWQKTWMRIHSDGTGTPQRLPLETGNYDLRCPQRAHSPCVVREQSGDRVSFFHFDLVSGKRQQIDTFRASEFGRDIHWSVAPSGKSLAILRNGEGRACILVLTLKDGNRNEVIGNGMRNIESLDWDAQESGWYASRPSGYGMDLIFISLDGHEQLIRRQTRNFVTWAVPSPDGRHLAILEWTASAKAYLLRRTPR
jgi:WD40 repeat protein